MYIASILGYLSWPFLILISYIAVRMALRIFEKRYKLDASEEKQA